MPEMVTEKSVTDDSDHNVEDLAIRTRTLLNRINRWYKQNFVLVICSICMLIVYFVAIISFFIQGEISNYPTSDPLPLQYYLNILIYLIIVFIMPIVGTYFVYRYLSVKAPFMQSWDEIKEMVVTFGGTTLPGECNNSSSSEYALKIILSYGRWLRTLWINRLFFMIFLLFTVNLIIFTPFTMFQVAEWSSETGWSIGDFQIEPWALGAWPITFFFPLAIICMAVWWYFNKNLKNWELATEKVKIKLGKFVDEWHPEDDF